ncbi:MAG: exo-alpha-sialidase [Clostridia bacterium]|nr:exo-alpha-sialidase [Clostridia bacterium]MBR2414839.1 exo-alpha-sialidase [Clostridia bacterium]
MNQPIVKYSEPVRLLPPQQNNARNSEGDFARLKDGRILFVFSRYNTDNSHDDAKCDIAALYSDDDGQTFPGEPVVIVPASAHNTLNLMSVSLLRLQNGKLAIFYLCKKDPFSEVYMRLANEDETVFGDPVKCMPFDEESYNVINNARIVQLKNGRILIPAAKHEVKTYENGDRHAEYFGKCRVYGSDDDGKTWKNLAGFIELPNPGYSETGLQEPGIIELPDGRLYQYFRTDRMFQFESFSSDHGETWTLPIPSRFTAPESPMLIRRNPYSGQYFAFWNPIPLYNGRLDPNEKWVHAGRNPFVMAVSDNGLDFSSFVVLESEEDHGYCYPSVFFLNEKEMLLSYCSGGPEDDMCLAKTTIRKVVIE